jgi:hypothetical protein
MTNSKRFDFAPFSLVISLSAVTMLWLLWRFPIPTCTASVVLLGFLLHCVRFARLIDHAVAIDTPDKGQPALSTPP